MQPGGRYKGPLLPSWQFLPAYRFEPAMDLSVRLIMHAKGGKRHAGRILSLAVHAVLKSGEGSLTAIDVGLVRRRA